MNRPHNLLPDTQNFGIIKKESFGPSRTFYKYLPTLKEVELAIQNQKAQKLRQEELDVAKEAKLYLESAKDWRKMIQTVKENPKSEILEDYDYNELVESMELCFSTIVYKPLFYFMDQASTNNHP